MSQCEQPEKYIYARMKIIGHDRKMKDVKRFAGNPMLKAPNLIEHSGLTALVFFEMARDADIPIQAKHIIWVLRHDIAEIFTGDLLYPAKNLNREVAEAWDNIEQQVIKKECEDLIPYLDINAEKILGPELVILWKMADMIEGAMTIIEEIKYGNSHPKTTLIRDNYGTAMGKLIGEAEKIDKALAKTLRHFVRCLVTEPNIWMFS